MPPVLLPVIRSTLSRNEGNDCTIRCKIVLLSTPRTPPPSNASTRNFLSAGFTGSTLEDGFVQKCTLDAMGGGRVCCCSGQGAPGDALASADDGARFEAALRRCRS